MTIARVVVHVDLDRADGAVLAVARAIAGRFAAGVIGLAACAPQPAAAAHGGFGVALALIEGERRRGETHLADAEAAFRAAFAGLTDVDWRAAIAPPVGFVAENARGADLIIAGAQRGPALTASLHALDVADLVLRAGRPVLVVPPDAGTCAAERVLVAWKDAREARRAVADALPLLRAARSVVVAEVSEAGAAAGEQQGAADVAEWLRRHGVEAEVRAVPASGSVAATLQALAEEISADLLVAGAYGHSRLQEWALGGVTRDLLAASPRCLLLSH